MLELFTVVNNENFQPRSRLELFTVVNNENFQVEKQKACVLIGVVRLCQHKTNINTALDGRGIEVL